MKYRYFSHPDKPLHKHTLGVTKLALKKADGLTSKIGDFPFRDALNFACLLHDIAKMNLNFQYYKLKKGDRPEDANTYSNHALLGAYLANNVIGHLINEHEERFEHHFPDLHRYYKSDRKGFITLLRSILHVIVAHHGNLRNINEISTLKSIYDDNGNQLHCEAASLQKFIKESGVNFPYMEFVAKALLGDRMIKPETIKALDFEVFINFLNAKEGDTMPVEHFMLTQMMFGILVESDKRDASYNSTRVSGSEKNSKSFNKAMRRVMLRSVKSMSKSSKSVLNETRASIQNEAANNLRKLLESTDKRVFELTAPTGAGKTFTMRLCDMVIKELMGMHMTSVYTLPFRAIIEQVESIMEREGIKVSSFSSSSDLASALDNMTEHQMRWKEEREKPLDKLRKEIGFSLQVFDANFIITTFQQVFETLLSNGNSKSMRLSNFKNKIFLIDEVQALPYEMQTFFSCWLQMFCDFFDSYAIIASATMPYLAANRKSPKDRRIRNISYDTPYEVFGKYAQAPPKLIDSDKYFGMDIFNRYRISYNGTIGESFDTLIDHIIHKGDKQVLVVFNTIADSKKFYKKAKAKHGNVVALNGEMKPNDKKRNIEKIRQCLANGVPILVSSTQCIEAGVDVDFPIVYRDFCPITSLIQTAGRCNREGKMPFQGEVILFKLRNWKEGAGHHKYRYQHVYEWFDVTSFMEDVLNSEEFLRKGFLEEKELYHVQKKFFESKHKSKITGYYKTHKKDDRKGEEHFLIDEILKGQFRTVGNYRILGSRDRQAIYYFGPDELIEKLREFHSEGIDSGEHKDFNKMSIQKQKVDEVRRKVINECITLRVEETPNGIFNSIIQQSDEFLGIMIPHKQYRGLYDPEYGLIGEEDAESTL